MGRGRKSRRLHENGHNVVVGITQYFTPGLYGGVDNAKVLYKYHRAWGYLTILMMLATIWTAVAPVSLLVLVRCAGGVGDGDEDGDEVPFPMTATRLPVKS